MSDQSQVEAKILKQVEFYFSDSNLPNDKFLKELTQQDDGWVLIETLASFARMKKLTTDLSVVVGALKKSESLLSVSDDGTKVKRTTELPAEMDSKRWIYAKGFNKEESTLESVTAYWAAKAEVTCVRMRRYAAKDKTRKFKGSVFVEFKTAEEAKKMLVEKHTCEDKELETMTKDAYDEMKKAEMQERRNKRKNIQRESPEEAEARIRAEADKKEYTSDLLIKFSGLSDQTTREDLKEVCEKAGAVCKYIDYSRGQEKGVVRLTDDSPIKAAALAAKLKEEEVKVLDVVVPTEPVTGEEEKQAWADTYFRQMSAAERHSNNKKKRRY